jgi:hypothetical protein
MPQQPPTPPEDNASEPLTDRINEPPQSHPLLIPTLYQIATSRYINIVFIPSLSHLRAYLAVSPPMVGESPPVQKFEKPGKNDPLLVVYGLVELHRDTSEWSAQGLGNTLAGLMEAGLWSKRKIVVLEERMTDDDLSNVYGDEGPMEAELEESKGKQLMKVWEEKVPMLNGSVRRAGLESEDGGWSGRTVEMGRIFGRWFKFGVGG